MKKKVDSVDEQAKAASRFAQQALGHATIATTVAKLEAAALRKDFEERFYDEAKVVHP